jgi:hypothetical protein
MKEQDKVKTTLKYINLEFQQSQFKRYLLVRPASTNRPTENFS